MNQNQAYKSNYLSYFLNICSIISSSQIWSERILKTTLTKCKTKNKIRCKNIFLFCYRLNNCNSEILMKVLSIWICIIIN